MTSEGHNIVQAGFHSCFYASLDHSLTEDMTFCPFRALRFYLDIFQILDRGSMCYTMHVCICMYFSGGIQGAAMSTGRQFC